jgi:hypothetical protein
VSESGQDKANFGVFCARTGFVLFRDSAIPQENYQGSSLPDSPIGKCGQLKRFPQSAASEGKVQLQTDILGEPVCTHFCKI